MKTKHRPYSSLPILDSYKAYAEIDLSALKHNYRILQNEAKSASPNTSLICVLKADAYGHGAEECCRALLSEGCRFFAVSSIEEAIDLRKICNELKTDANILILGYIFPSQARLLAKYDIITTLVDIDFAEKLAAEAEKSRVRVKCHVKLDTGMNRIGFPARGEDEARKTAEDIARISAYSSLDICGMFTHFARADESERLTTDRQAALFAEVDKALLSLGVDVGFRHLCNTAGTVFFPSYHFDACRVGIAVYGTLSGKVIDSLPLRPVMKFCTLISHIHKIRKGDSVSYGGIYTAEEDRLIATLPVGYADGFIRAYGNAELSVITKNGIKKAPIVGRICMDQCMIDITDTGASVDDKVMIFGNSPEELSELARLANTIEYEVLCLVSARAPRIYTEG
ncbi:MAG: alanine racemase [Ruminococcaceae bacterium]|nr:alanine racemase [Oscillospiraceae bacterium]